VGRGHRRRARATTCCFELERKRCARHSHEHNRRVSV
jgi:hypothetical protein